MFAKSHVSNTVTDPSASPIAQNGTTSDLRKYKFWSITRSLCPLEDLVYCLFSAHKVFVIEVVSKQVRFRMGYVKYHL